jgi:hypothetical protein
MQIARAFLFDALELGAVCAFLGMIACLASALGA